MTEPDELSALTMAHEELFNAVQNPATTSRPRSTTGTLPDEEQREVDGFLQTRTFTSSRDLIESIMDEEPLRTESGALLYPSTSRDYALELAGSIEIKRQVSDTVETSTLAVVASPTVSVDDPDTARTPETNFIQTFVDSTVTFKVERPPPFRRPGRTQSLRFRNKPLYPISTESDEILERPSTPLQSSEKEDVLPTVHDEGYQTQPMTPENGEPIEIVPEMLQGPECVPVPPEPQIGTPTHGLPRTSPKASNSWEDAPEILKAAPSPPTLEIPQESPTAIKLPPASKYTPEQKAERKRLKNERMAREKLEKAATKLEEAAKTEIAAREKEKEATVVTLPSIFEYLEEALSNTKKKKRARKTAKKGKGQLDVQAIAEKPPKESVPAAATDVPVIALEINEDVVKLGKFWPRRLVRGLVLFFIVLFGSMLAYLVSRHVWSLVFA